MGQNTNSDQKIGLDLTRFAADLAGQRDEYQALYDEFGDRADLGCAQHARHTLAMLHRASDGEFGETLDDQLAAKVNR